MANLILPKNYEPVLDLMESQRAIKKIKDYLCSFHKRVYTIVRGQSTQKTNPHRKGG